MLLHIYNHRYFNRRTDFTQTVALNRPVATKLKNHSLNLAFLICDACLLQNAVVRGTLLGLQYMGKDNGGKGGVVVNIASILGLAPLAGSPVYVATKHAVIGLTRSFGVSTTHRNGNSIRNYRVFLGTFSISIASNMKNNYWYAFLRAFS